MKTGIIVVVLVAILGIGGFVLLGGSDDESSNSEMDNATSEQTDTNINDDVTVSVQNETAETENNEQITTAMVAEHASESDCWTIVDGSVYDITEYVPRHPGGDTILAACGTDGSSLFNERTTVSGETVGSGSPHSPSAANQLESFKIGALTE